MKAKNSSRIERRGVGLAIAAFESLGFAFREQTQSDFGIDAHAELIETEQPTGQLLGIQLKSGQSYLSAGDDIGYIFRTDKEHVEYWLNHALPVLICLCDVNTEILYWQVVNSVTATSTGRGFKFLIPTSQKVDVGSVGTFRDLLTPVISADRYTIFKTDDTSHVGAKRYSFEVVINGNATKAEVAAIVRQLTSDGAKRRYYRNHFVEGQWGDSDAHVVWTLIYPSAEDHTRNNHICRSLWIQDDLEEKFRPMGFHGENVGDNIIVEWNSSYEYLAKRVSTNTLSKEKYLFTILPLIEELKIIMGTLEEQFLALEQGKITESEFMSRSDSFRTRISKIYSEVSDMSFAPFECRDMDEKLESLVAYLDNISLCYSDNGLGTCGEVARLNQSLQQRSFAREALQYLEYEISKVR